MFWDGTHWIDERRAAPAAPPTPRRRLRDALATLPIVLIFATAFLAPRWPMAHRAINVVYDLLLIGNTVYFWRRGPSPLGTLYLVAVIGTALDFVMHFVIDIA